LVVWQMLSPPFLVTAGKFFTQVSFDSFLANCDKNHIVAGRLNIPHLPHVEEASFTTYSSDIKAMNKDVYKLIQPIPIKK